MKSLLVCLFLGFSTLLSADSLDIVFRYYAADGRVVSAPLTIAVPDGQAQQISPADAGGWQHWRISYQGTSITLQISNGDKEQALNIHIHPDWKATLKTLVINRVQESKEAQILKVNHLTCRWTAGIAYPVEYRFNNPLDGQELKLDIWSCAGDHDSMSVHMEVLSDSVILYRCGEFEGIFIKYYLGSDGKFFRSFAPNECGEFNNPVEWKLYALLKDEKLVLRYAWEGSQFVISEPKGCWWGFEF